MIVAVILARAGSKGIPRKNLQQVGGDSLVARAARKAISAGFDRVFVYSDDPEIRRVAEAAGALAPDRPADVSGDETTSEETIARFFADCDPGKEIEWLGLVQATTPFLPVGALKDAIAVARENVCDSVVTVCDVVRFLAYSGGYPQRAFVPFYPYRRMRQHFAGKIFMENGGLYMSRRAVWLAGSRYGAKVQPIKVGWWESIEIDDPTDLDVARAIAPIMDAGAR